MIYRILKIIALVFTFNVTELFQTKYHYKYMSSKQGIISKMYFDKSGFGSKAVTLNGVQEKDKAIKMQDAEEFFRKNIEQKKAVAWIQQLRST